jgi:hypothetical protein
MVQGAEAARADRQTVIPGQPGALAAPQALAAPHAAPGTAAAAAPPQRLPTPAPGPPAFCTFARPIVAGCSRPVAHRLDTEKWVFRGVICLRAAFLVCLHSVFLWVLKRFARSSGTSSPVASTVCRGLPSTWASRAASCTGAAAPIVDANSRRYLLLHGH